MQHVTWKLGKKASNFGFYLNSESEYVTSILIWVLLVVIYVLHNGIHRGIMTIYYKSRTSRCNMCRKSWKIEKHPNSGFFFNGVPNYVTSTLIWVLLFIIYVSHHNGITQRPHDHLFQKSCVWVQHVTWKLGNKKATNSGFCFNGESEYVTSILIWVLLVIIYVLCHNGITQRPRDHLLRKTGIMLQHLSWKLGNLKSAKFEGFL